MWGLYVLCVCLSLILELLCVVRTPSSFAFRCMLDFLSYVSAYSPAAKCRPAGRCLQLVRPIRGKAGSKRGLLSSIALIRSPEKTIANFCCQITTEQFD